MTSFPRRSARLSPHLAHNPSETHSLTSASVPSFPHFSQPSSSSTTSHPSPTNNTIHPATTSQQSQAHLQVQSQYMAQQPNVPLPSPSAAELNPFFQRPHSQPDPFASQHMSTGFMSQQLQPSVFGMDAQQQGQQPPQQLHPHTNSMSQPHPQNVHDISPGQLPPNFLAEAAKRAQMACLMRDMEEVTL